MTSGWTKSSFCADKSCVEVAQLDGDVIGVRDGKNTNQPHLSFSFRDWNNFLDGLNAGEIDFS